MFIRKAVIQDIDNIQEIYKKAREYMKNTGNSGQWGNTHPPLEMLIEDIRVGQLYVGVFDDNEIHCVFAFLEGIDKTYLKIDGSWLNNDEYMTIHRIASDGKYRGVFGKCMDYCKEKCNNLRIDTHENNKTMQHVLEKCGFIRCGIIYLEDGDPRIAYQYVKI